MEYLAYAVVVAAVLLVSLFLWIGAMALNPPEQCTNCGHEFGPTEEVHIVASWAGALAYCDRCWRSLPSVGGEDRRC